MTPKPIEFRQMARLPDCQKNFSANKVASAAAGNYQKLLFMIEKSLASIDYRLSIIYQTDQSIPVHRAKSSLGSVSKSVEIQMSQIQFHSRSRRAPGRQPPILTVKARRHKEKDIFSNMILGVLVSLGVLGAKVFSVSTEMDALPLVAPFAISPEIATIASQQNQQVK